MVGGFARIEVMTNSLPLSPGHPTGMTRRRKPPTFEG